MKKLSNIQGILSLSPMLVLVILIVGFSLYYHDAYKVPVVIVFIITAIVSLLTLKNTPLSKRISIFSESAGQSDLMLMVWIFILAGAFASSAKAMGAVDATVNLTLQILPANMLLPGMFLAACVISLSIGTSVGTIAALMPIAAEISKTAGIDIAMLTAATVGGAFFGDNLSFISDTTIVATKTQGCAMRDKFRTNFMIALPAAIITLIIYIICGTSQTVSSIAYSEISVIKIIPYLTVLVTAICGLNVMVALPLGIVLTGIIGILCNDYDFISWCNTMTQGIFSMSETILIAILAGGLFGVIRHSGGISWLIHKIINHTKNRKEAELAIAALVSMTNICTANNTVAILSVGTIAREISKKFNIAPRRAASILDTFSCFVQGIIPYGAQLLIASGLAAIPATSLMPYLYYPYLLGGAALTAIVLFKHKEFIPSSHTHKANNSVK